MGGGAGREKAGGGRGVLILGGIMKTLEAWVEGMAGGGGLGGGARGMGTPDPTGGRGVLGGGGILKAPDGVTVACCAAG